MAAKTAGLLRAGDRVVFVGDSITEQRTFTNDVENYLVGRYPGLNLEFVNAGWGGDTAAGGAKRFARDVLALQPDVVLFCYGMNDAGWGYAKVPEAVSRYRANLADMLGRLRRAGIRAALLTPGVLDDRLPGLAWLRERTDYNRKDLRAIAEETLRLARARRVPVIDLHARMTGAMARSQPRGISIGNDGIHPDAAASLLMTDAALRALGVPRDRARWTVNAGGRRERGSRGVEPVSAAAGRLAFAVVPNALPGYLEEPSRKMLPFVRLREDFLDARVSVRGLAAGPWVLRVDGRLGPVLDRRELAVGVRLAELWGSDLLDAARRVALVTREKANAFRQAWRTLALPDTYVVDAPYDPVPHRLGFAFLQGLERWRRKLLAPPRVRFELRAVPKDPPPAGSGDALTRWRIERGFAPVPPREKTPIERVRLTAPGAAVPADWGRVALDGTEPAEAVRPLYATGTPGRMDALATLVSEIPQTVRLWVPARCSATVAVNGRSGATQTAGRRERGLAVRLVRGRNRILLGVWNPGGSLPGFRVSLTGVTQPVRQLS